MRGHSLCYVGQESGRSPPPLHQSSARFTSYSHHAKTIIKEKSLAIIYLFVCFVQPSQAFFHSYPMYENVTEDGGTFHRCV